MSEAPPPTPRDQEMLAELAELDLALARKLQGQAMAAEDPETTADLARAYQRVARSLRQTLALKARLAQDRERARAQALRDNPPPPPPIDYVAIQRRRYELTDALERIIWFELDREDPEQCDRADDRCAKLTDHLRREAALPGFAEPPLDHQVAQIAARFDLDPDDAARWRDLPPLPGDDEEEAAADKAAGRDPPTWASG